LNNEEITRLAELIVNKQLHLHWQTYLLSGLLLFIISAGGTYVGSYFKKRGETKALNTDQKEILRQLKVNSEATEKIKHQVEHKVWKEKEVSALKKEKLELLLQDVIKLQSAHNKMQHNFIMGENINYADYPELDILDTISMRQKLYFPELSTAIYDVLATYRAIHPYVFGHMGKPENKEVVLKLEVLDGQMINKYHDLLNSSNKVIDSLFS
jgi:hypothetical protein